METGKSRFCSRLGGGQADQIQHLLFSPDYMDKILAHFYPVILLDAAHLQSHYNGTIFIYLGFSGYHEVYIFAFRISAQNEDYASWNIFNKLFVRSCPSVSACEEGQTYSKFCGFVIQRQRLGKLIA